MYRLAVAYYEDGLTQQEIANKFGISRIMVSRLLKRAIQEKMVEIKIHPPEDHDTQLEQDLEKLYGLDEVILVDCKSTNDLTVLEEIGQGASGWLYDRLDGKETIALSWGKTLLAMVNAMPQANYPEIKIVQMIGGLGEPGADIHGADLTRRLAQTFNGRPRILSSPGIVKSKEICDGLKEDLQIAETLQLAANADIALVGIGSFTPGSNIYDAKTILNDHDKNFLLQKKAIGDISLRFYDEAGQMIEDGLNERIVGLDAVQIRKIPRRIGVSGGTGKFLTILAACRTQLINVLITDRNTGIELLNRK